MSLGAVEDRQRVVALIDMDCFYCQVEAREDPGLKGKPLAVVQYKTWRGGGIIAVNYEARALGVTRNMRGDDARKLCADINLVHVPQIRDKADLSKYREAGKEVIQSLLQFAGATVERASVDEAYVDLTALVEDRMAASRDRKDPEGHQLPPDTFAAGYESIDEGARAWSRLGGLGGQGCPAETDGLRILEGARIVHEMRRSILERTGFECSAGIAPNKMLAKLACGLNKPNKQTVLSSEKVPDLFSTVKIGKVRGLGGKLGDSVSQLLNCQTMGDLATLSLADIRASGAFDEKTALWLRDVARGIDPDPVKERDLPKSIGCGKNFRGPEVLDTREKVEYWMRSLCEELLDRLSKDREANARTARTLSVSITTDAGRSAGLSLSRAGPLPENLPDLDKLVRLALGLIAKANEAPPSTDPRSPWRPKLRNLTIAATKFQEIGSSKKGSSCFPTKSVANFFQKASTGEGTSSDSAAPAGAPLGPDTGDVVGQGEPDSLVRKDLGEAAALAAVPCDPPAPKEDVDDGQRSAPVPGDEALLDLQECQKCRAMVSAFEMPEHLDFHLAQELQLQFRRELPAHPGPAAASSGTTSCPRNGPKRRTTDDAADGASSSSSSKRLPKKPSQPESKKHKDIASFFTKLS